MTGSPPADIGPLRLSDGEAIRRERCEGRGGTSAERRNEAGTLWRRTLRAGYAGPMSCGLRLGLRTTSTVAGILDLVPITPGGAAPRAPAMLRFAATKKAPDGVRGVCGEPWLPLTL